MQRMYRFLFYGLGVLILSCGVMLTIKSGLGSTPVSSPPYCLSLLFGLDFGGMTFCLYSLFVVGEIIVQRKVRIMDLLQLPYSLAFSQLLNFFGAYIPYDSTEHGFTMNFLILLLAVVFTGVGITLMVNMRLLPNPGDGLTQVVSDRYGCDQGLAKNVLDLACVSLTILIGVFTTGKVVAIGLGTVVSMLGVGRVISVTNRLFKAKICQLAGTH